ncbi:MAG: hypothetical protein PHU32_04095 [Candidatus ainarchaeum sp.]|nr:hypothetical protein [Candidatus ainarchaeum sp.]
MQDNKYLTALTVFRELYTREKGIYDVLVCFIKNIIITENFSRFTLTEIKNSLESLYDFYIPEAVLKTVLKKMREFLTLNDNIYLVNNFIKQKNYDFQEKFKDAQEANDLLLDSLCDFISKKQNKTIDKGEIVKLFSDYLLDKDDENKYKDLFSVFILENDENKEILKTIKEGVIIYYGLIQNSNLNELGSWRQKLTIYLDTEIIFSLSGYNGGLYKSIIDDLFNLIAEINDDFFKKNKKDLIKIKYFSDTLQEIDYYFKTAEKILKNELDVNPAKTAMVEILKGCGSIGDIQIKKQNLFVLLRNKGIILDNNDYYKEENHEYNLEEEKVIEEISKKNIFSTKEEIEKTLKVLNYINILRKGKKVQRLEDAEYIFLTEKNVAKLIDLFFVEKKFLFINTDWLTNKLWFDLNKGFNNGNLPKTFSIITKAQIVLSGILHRSISSKYEELKKDFKEGKITEEIAIAAIAELRRGGFNPEDINKENVDEVFSGIEDEVQKYYRENEFSKEELRRVKDNLEVERKKTQEMEKELSELRMEKAEGLKDKEKKELRKKNRRKVSKIILLIFFSLIVLGVIIFFCLLNPIITIIITVLFGAIPLIFNKKTKTIISEFINN